MSQFDNWGEPEGAPHKHEVCTVCLCLSVCLSFCLSFCPYVHDTKIYKNNSNLRVPSVVALYTNVMTKNLNKQVLILISKFTAGHV